MRIVIAGMGDVGFYLAERLSREEHHITVIDVEEHKLTRVENYAQVLIICGSASSCSVLQAAGVENADLFLAVTSVDEVNFTAAVLAKQLGAARTLARVSSSELSPERAPFDLTTIGIDHVIYPEEQAGREIAQLIRRSAATDIHEFGEGLLTLIGLKLDEGTPILGLTIEDIMRDLEEKLDFRIVLIKRGDKTLVPRPDYRFSKEDQIFLMTLPEGLSTVLKLTGKHKERIRNVLILGGGKIGRTSSLLLQEQFKVKLIESDAAKAAELAEELTDTLIIHGDCRDLNLMQEERIGQMDAIIAVTDDSETNIISCLMARELGVKKTIAYVENAEYARLTHAFGIDALINKKLISANDISCLVRSAKVINLITLQGIDAHVLEFIVPEKALITEAPLNKLEFPRGAILGGLIRGDAGQITVGQTQVQPGDRVVVFMQPDVYEDVEMFFRP